MPADLEVECLEYTRFQVAIDNDVFQLIVGDFQINVCFSDQTTSEQAMMKLRNEVLVFLANRGL